VPDLIGTQDTLIDSQVHAYSANGVGDGSGGSRGGRQGGGTKGGPLVEGVFWGGRDYLLSPPRWSLRFPQPRRRLLLTRSRWMLTESCWMLFLPPNVATTVGICSFCSVSIHLDKRLLFLIQSGQANWFI